MEREELAEYYDEGIDLYELFLVIKKRWWIAFIVTLVVFCLALIYAFFTPKVYRVFNNLVFLQIIEIPDGKSIIMNFNEHSNIQKAAELGMEVGVLRKIRGIRVSDISNTNILKIEVDALEKEAGVMIIDALPHYIMTRPYIITKIKYEKELARKNVNDLKKILDDPFGSLHLSGNHIIYLPDLYSYMYRYNKLNTTLSQLEAGEIVRLADRTIASEVPYWPKKKLIITWGLIIGLFLGVFSTFFMEWFVNARILHHNRHYSPGETKA